eukprot:gene12744-9111_t
MAPCYAISVAVAWSNGCFPLNTVKDLTYTAAFQQTLGFKSSDIDELLALRFPAMDPNERANWRRSTAPATDTVARPSK